MDRQEIKGKIGQILLKFCYFFLLHFSFLVVSRCQEVGFTQPSHHLFLRICRPDSLAHCKQKEIIYPMDHSELRLNYEVLLSKLQET